jgi:hypothetical protein
MDKDDKPWKLRAAFVSTLAIIIAYVFLIEHAPESSSESNHTPATKSSAGTAADNKVAAATRGAAMLRNMMKNPRSFDLDKALVSPTATTVCYAYYAQNGFGASSIGRAILSNGAIKIEDPQEAPQFAQALRNPKENISNLIDAGVSLSPDTMLTIERLDDQFKIAEERAVLAAALKGQGFDAAWLANCIQPGMQDVTSQAK